MIKISHSFGTFFVGHIHRQDVVKKLTVLIRKKYYDEQEERDFSVRPCQYPHFVSVISVTYINRTSLYSAVVTIWITFINVQ
jgi:hypothetical protein